jgi:hypothetical protein
MSRLLIPAAALLLSLGLSFAAQATVHGNSGTLPSCEIRVDQRDDAVMLEGLVSAAEPISGTYQLDIRQNGAGTSQISQSGDFAVPAGSSSSLGMVSLTKTAGGYRATLRVRWNSDAADCKATAHNAAPLSLR